MQHKREEFGWTQTQLGHDPRVRIHQSFISLCETGMGLPTDDQRRRLAAVLGIPPEKLLEPVPSVVELVTEPDRG